ncbi:endonuclease VII domain-containing protein [Streptomyces sp. NPDC050315]|uniref:endonuclease VII domain-containing protein n=1 Tax=Streptomyces sp. NPDC050315 TaxID=3155039 RepID=UPI0034286B27
MLVGGALMAMKTCGTCGAEYVSNGAVRYCGDTCRLQAQAAQLAGTLYGLTLEQALAIRAVQACMICQSTESGFESGIFAIDHCHETGVVRGALCQSCNFMLGNARDDVDVLLQAIKYLSKDHSSEPWNQGASRRQQLNDRLHARLSTRLEEANKALRASELRVLELEAIIAATDEDVVTAARRRARDSDAVDRFVAEMIRVAPASRIAASTVRQAWTDWAGGASCPVASLQEALNKAGGVLRRSSTSRYWEGITLSAEG